MEEEGELFILGLDRFSRVIPRATGLLYIMYGYLEIMTMWRKERVWKKVGKRKKWQLLTKMLLIHIRVQR